MNKKLGIFGSRAIADDRAEGEIREFLLEHPEFTTIVTSQEPRGICAVAQAYAKKYCLVLELHFLNRAKYARGAFEHRSQDIIDASDFILLIHDGESVGTSNELEQTKKNRKPFKYIKMSKTTELDRTMETDIFHMVDKKKNTDMFPELEAYDPAELLGTQSRSRNVFFV